MPDVERIARLIAIMHGGKMLYRKDGETVTVASKHGYGNWGYSPEKYADRHWQEYVQAAEAVIDLLIAPPGAIAGEAAPELKAHCDACGPAWKYLYAARDDKCYHCGRGIV